MFIFNILQKHFNTYKKSIEIYAPVNTFWKAKLFTNSIHIRSSNWLKEILKILLIWVFFLI